MKTRTYRNSFIKYLTGLALASSSVLSTYAQSEKKSTILYDAISYERSNSIWNAEGKTRTGRFLAQQFMTGNLGVVSSVSIRLETLTTGTNGKAAGMLNVKVFDDLEGKPDSEVAMLGEIDIQSIKTRSQGGSIVTFDKPIIGLKPNSAYHVVLDYVDAKAFVRRCCGGGIDQAIERVESVAWSLAERSDDSEALLMGAQFDTVEDPSILDGVYSPPPAKDYFWSEARTATREYVGMMKITESIDDLPMPEIISLERSSDAISLTWKSLPYKTYTLESSESLEDEQWNEIEDGIESSGDETKFVDNDTTRLAAKTVFYRVRREF